MSELRQRVGALRERLWRAAQTPPRDGALRVSLGAQAIGVTAASIAQHIGAALKGAALDAAGLRLPVRGDDVDVGYNRALLAEVAASLRAAGLLRDWRDEALDVHPADDLDAPPLASIERAACRPLGIATTAVHLNAFTPAGDLVVAQRAAEKSVDPGMWDNLVGGMVASGEAEMTALAREAWEEAGISVGSLELLHGSRLRERRPVPEGYLIETIQVFDAVLPAGVEPRNHDGEVQAFAILSPHAVIEAIERGEFTFESSLVTLDALHRRLR